MNGLRLPRMTLDERLPYSAIYDRPQIEWPNGRRLAVWVVVAAQHKELSPPAGAHPSRSRVPPPDIAEYSVNDYGNRVAFWRMLPILDGLGSNCSIALNLAVCELYPEIWEAIHSRRWRSLCHGLTNTRFSNGLSEEAEREMLTQCKAIYGRYSHQPMRGMIAPAGTCTDATPDLLAELGFSYCADYAHDDQPQPILTDHGRLISMPYTYDLNDGVLGSRAIEGEDFLKMCLRQISRLRRDAESVSRVMCITVHPYRMGQPHRVRYLAKLVEALQAADDIWLTTGDQIAEHYLDKYYDEMLAVLHRDPKVATSGGAQ